MPRFLGPSLVKRADSLSVCPILDGFGAFPQNAARHGVGEEPCGHGTRMHETSFGSDSPSCLVEEWGGLQGRATRAAISPAAFANIE